MELEEVHWVLWSPTICLITVVSYLSWTLLESVKASRRNMVRTQLATASLQFWIRENEVFDLSSFMSQRTFQNTNSPGQTLFLEQLVPRQGGSVLVEAAHSVLFLVQPARINKSRAPLLPTAAFQCGRRGAPDTRRFLLGNVLNLTRSSWRGGYRKVGRAHFASFRTLFFLIISGASFFGTLEDL